MSRKPNGEVAMTGAERQAKHRQRNKDGQELLMSLAAAISAAGEELEDWGKLKPKTAITIKALARKIRQNDGTVTPKV